MRPASFVLVVIAWLLGGLRRRRQRGKRAAGGVQPDVERDAAAVTEEFAGEITRLTSHLPTAVLLCLVGSALLVASVAYGRNHLTTDDPPIGGDHAIAFRGPASEVKRRGIIIATSVAVSDCKSTIGVAVEATGTGEYWQRHRRVIPADGKFAFVIRDPKITDVKVGYGSVTTALDPTNPSIVPYTPAPQKEPIRDVEVTRRKETTTVTGSIRGWRDSWTPVRLDFRADWLLPRSDASCYLRLPSLTGVSARPTVSGRDGTLLAFNNLVVFGGAVDPANSRPAPDLFSGSRSAWKCEEASPDLRRPPTPDELRRGELGGGLVFSGKGLAFEERVYRRGTFRYGGCDALATIDESGASATRDLQILIVGGVLGLALALMVQGFVGLVQALLSARAAKRIANSRLERLARSARPSP